MTQLFTTTFLATCFICSYGQRWTETMDSSMTLLARNGLFHGQILIEEKGKILFHKAYGTVNGQDITAETPLVIESVSKAITACAVLILHDRGQLHIDNPLTMYYPELAYNDVTIKNLLNMTSGLPRFQGTVEKYGDGSKVYSTNELINLVARHLPEARPPGEAFSYNDDNYALLAGIVEKISRERFALFVQRHIFGPLGMTNSYFLNRKQAFEGVPLSSKVGPALGAGDIYSTARDLDRFVDALFSYHLISAKSLNESFVRPQLKSGKGSDYGFAWRIHQNDSVKEVYIVGEGEHTRASIQYFFNGSMTFIYLHNISGTNWKGVYSVMRNIWAGKPFEMPGKRIVYDIDTNLYNKYVGKYLSEAFGLLHITAENGKLYLRPDPIPGKEELVPSSDATFYFSDQALEWEFYLDERDNVKGLGLKGKPETMGPKQ